MHNHFSTQNFEGLIKEYSKVGNVMIQSDKNIDKM